MILCKSNVMLSCPRRHIYKKIDFLRTYLENIFCNVNIQSTSSQIFILQLELITDFLQKQNRFSKFINYWKKYYLFYLQNFRRLLILVGYIFLPKLIETSQKINKGFNVSISRNFKTKLLCFIPVKTI
jgi:hypothetical protein